MTITELANRLSNTYPLITMSNPIDDITYIFEVNPPSELIRILEDMKTKRHNDVLGICFNLDYHLKLGRGMVSPGYDLVNMLSVGWEHHTGEQYNPVPNVRDLDLWKGRNLVYRLSLLDYMIEQLKSLEF